MPSGVTVSTWILMGMAIASQVVIKAGTERSDEFIRAFSILRLTIHFQPTRDPLPERLPACNIGVCAQKSTHRGKDSELPEAIAINSQDAKGCNREHLDFDRHGDRFIPPSPTA
jgi:hypothetical protein